MVRTDILPEARASSLASGVYALVFTDIEGSTELLQRIGDSYGPTLLRHQRIVRDALARHDGREVGTGGDSFFVLFNDANEALAAAVELQRSMAAEPWPERSAPRLRLGLHYGMVRVMEGECTGLDVHRAARICAAGHGGQILLSSEAHDAMSDRVEADLGVTLRDLGQHRLKDLRYPEHVLDVSDPKIGIVFPPIRSVETTNTNITALRGEIVGRDQEVAEVRALLESHPGRMLTIVGAGGTGKSLLAERIAALSLGSFPDGVYFVDLSGTKESELVLADVAAALGVRDISTRPLIGDLAAAIGTSRMLLVLDTFEHLLEAGGPLAQLLGLCPRLRILVTSQAPLGIAPERTFALEPLELPDDDDPAPENAPAMRVFIDKAREADPDFALTPENQQALLAIVRRMEGIPLALEIAAAQLTLLSPEQLLERLKSRARTLRAARRDVARHRTLKDAIAWSDQLLSPSERDVFHRLSVFAGGFTLDDAEAVLESVLSQDIDVLDAISTLVSRNLLHRRSIRGTPRFTMYDIVREYALDEIEASGQLGDTAARHVAFYTGLAVRHGPKTLGSDQRRHVLRLLDEADNVRAALRGAIDGRDLANTAALIGSLHWFWIAQGRFTEALRWIEDAVALADAADGGAADAAVIHTAAAYTKGMAGDYAACFDHGEAGERQFKAAEDMTGAARAAIIGAVGAVATERTEDPMPIIGPALAGLEEAGDVFYHALGLTIVGELCRLGGAAAEAEAAYLAALPLFEKADSTFWQAAVAANIGHIRLRDDDPDAAAAYFARSLALAESYNYSVVACGAASGLAGLALRRDDAEDCLRIIAALATRMERVGASFEPTDQAEVDAYETAATEALGAARSAAIRNEGGMMPWPEALDLARQFATQGGAEGPSGDGGAAAKAE